MELAAKHRPTTFKSVIGQTTAKKTLAGIIKTGKIPPTFLFSGAFGSGKTTIARIIGKRLNCFAPNEENPCLKCESCKMSVDQHPDITELNAADRRGIDEIRSLIDVSRLRPAFKHRVFIIDECYPGETLVMVDYDKAVPIRDIVESKYPYVLGYDLDQKKIVRKKVTGHYSRPYHDKLVTITVNNLSFKCTRRQEIYVVGKGMTPAEEIVPSDKFLHYNENFRYTRLCNTPKTTRKDCLVPANNALFMTPNEIQHALDTPLHRSHDGTIVYDISVADTANFFVVPGTCTNFGAPVLSSNCHALTPQALQASLKLFEEPSKASTFIMVTTEPDKLPKTILSRATKVNFSTIQPTVMAKWLYQIAQKEQIEYLKKEHFIRIAEASIGHPRDAIKLLDQIICAAEASGEEVDEAILTTVVKDVVRESPQELIRNFVSAVLDENLKKAFQVAKKVDNQEYFLKAVVEMFRQVVYYSVDQSLCNPYFNRQISKMRETDIDVAAMLLQIFAEAYQQAKNYLVPADVLLDLAIAKTADGGE